MEWINLNEDGLALLWSRFECDPHPTRNRIKKYVIHGDTYDPRSQKATHMSLTQEDLVYSSVVNPDGHRELKRYNELCKRHICSLKQGQNHGLALTKSGEV